MNKTLFQHKHIINMICYKTFSIDEIQKSALNSACIFLIGDQN